MENQQSADVVIITALDKERDAVLRYLDAYETVPIKNHTVYHLPHHNAESAYRIVLCCPDEMGNVAASIATTQAIHDWNPNMVILTGIMGGVKGNERSLGDLIVAKQIVGYEAGKLTNTGAERHFDVRRSNDTLVKATQNFFDKKWALNTKILRPDRKTSLPKIHRGIVASGEKVIADMKTLPELQNYWSKLAGIEMESYGAASAADKLSCPFLMIKSICDWANPDKNDDWQAYAADVAAAYVVNFLRSKPVEIESNHIKQSRIPKETRSFPKILPYLPNRGRQKAQLKTTIQDYQTKYLDRRQRPLLCLIYGDENEHDKFINCLLNDFFLENFSEYFRHGPSEPDELFIENSSSVNDLHEEILKSLAEKFGCTNNKETIAKTLAQFRRPIVIHVCIWVRDLTWQDKQKTIIDGFVEFWKDWPNFFAKHHLFLVFVTFRYENHKKKTSFSSIMEKLSWKQQSILLKMQKQFRTLSQEPFENQGIHLVVLPELKSINWTQVYNWTNKYQKQLVPFYSDIDVLQRKAKALYEKRDAIPMRELAGELEKLLTNPDK